MFDNEIVCLGAGIRSNADESITTTVNQCWLHGDVFTGTKKQTAVKKEHTNISSKDAFWAWHDSIGYFFPQGGDVQISKSEQTGSWKHINNSFTDEEEKGGVFKLWFDHGKKPQNSSYAYIVLPGINNAEEMKKYDSKKIHIIANNDSLQAVQHDGLNITQVVFYKAGKLNVAGFSISVDEPCILMLKNGGSNANIYVADPTQTETTISITIQNSKTGKQKIMTIDLPKKEMAGSMISEILENNIE